MFQPHKVGNIKAEVCHSLLSDSDWTADCCDLTRGCIYVCCETGEITLDGVTVPLSWGERRCVKKCVRKRMEKSFKLAGRDFRHRGHAP